MLRNDNPYCLAKISQFNLIYKLAVHVVYSRCFSIFFPISVPICNSAMGNTNSFVQDLNLAASNFEQVLEATPNKAAVVRLPTSHHENYQS